MGTAIRTVFVAAGAIVTFAVTARRVDFDTIGVVLMLAALLGMLFALVWWDSWPASERRADDDLVTSNTTSSGAVAGS